MWAAGCRYCDSASGGENTTDKYRERRHSPATRSYTKGSESTPTVKNSTFSPPCSLDCHGRFCSLCTLWLIMGVWHTLHQCPWFNPLFCRFERFMCSRRSVRSFTFIFRSRCAISITLTHPCSCSESVLLTSAWEYESPGPPVETRCTPAPLGR